MTSDDITIKGIIQQRDLCLIEALEVQWLLEQQGRAHTSAWKKGESDEVRME